MSLLLDQRMCKVNIGNFMPEKISKTRILDTKTLCIVFIVTCIVRYLFYTQMDGNIRYSM